MNILGLAVYWLKVDVVRLLLAHGADPNVEDNDHMTVFDHLRLMDPPADPASLERLHEIRQLLGDPAARCIGAIRPQTPQSLRRLVILLRRTFV